MAAEQSNENTKTTEDAEKAKTGKTSSSKPSKKLRVTIHAGEADEDKGDVFLTHNYKQLQIQRDKEVLIPEEFVAVLENAAIDTRGTDKDGNATGGRIPRYSYTVKPE